MLEAVAAQQRERMVREQIAGRGITDAAVLDVLRQIPRHRFVSEALAEEAYADHPLAIGEEQTISQPYMVALMTALLDAVQVADLAYDLYFAVTVQEENGLLGASSLRTEVTPDLAIGLEVGLAGDVPTVKDETMPTALGAGPLVIHKDSMVHYTRDLIWRVVDVAAQASVPIQHAILENFGSDGSELVRQGIPTALVAPPTRYTHSPFEMVDERDLDATLRLLAAFVTTPPPA